MKIKDYFTTKNVIEGLNISILLSAFIYIEYFGLLNGYILLIINTFFATLGIYLLLKASPKSWFFTGFFLGVFWIWWIGVSFYYYKMPFLIPIAIFFIGLLYGFIFLFTRKISDLLALKIEDILTIKKEKTIYILNALAILALSYLSIFSFDWLKLRLIFINTIFGIELWQFILIVFAIALFLTTKKWYILLLVLLTIDFKKPIEYKPNYLKDIELVSTNIDVRDKWKPQNQDLYTKMALSKISSAIAKDKKLIIFPESILPYFLNLEQERLKKFLKLSNYITIVIGSLYYKGPNNHRNTAYIIKDGDYKIANKVVLVPFGEANPLPKWASGIINKIFFDGAVDYSADKEYTYINALNKKYKVAICYEGTNKKTYQDNPEFLILLSNNAWFKPSIEPVLQKLLIKYYSKLHKTTIYHSINGSKSYIITPHPDDSN